MANKKQVTITLNKNSPTVIEFDLSINDSASRSTRTDATVQLRINKVIDHCDVVVTAKHKADNKWIITVPNLTEFTSDRYSFILEVIINHYFFTPVEGSLRFGETADPVVKVNKITEGINSGATTNVSLDTPVPGKMQEPEFPEEYREIDNKLRYTAGQNTDDEIELDKLKHSVGSFKGNTEPTPAEPPAPLDAKKIAMQLIQAIIPVIKQKPELKGKLLDAKTKYDLTKSPTYKKELEQILNRNKRVKDLLDL